MVFKKEQGGMKIGKAAMKIEKAALKMWKAKTDFYC